MSAALPIPVAPADLAFPATREALEAHIEALIALLDGLDGDPDLEPSFGWLARPGTDDAEPDDDGEPSGDEGEPWLGALEAGMPRVLVGPFPSSLPPDPELVHDLNTSQLAWSRGCLDDREEWEDGQEADDNADGSVVGDTQEACGRRRPLHKRK